MKFRREVRVRSWKTMRYGSHGGLDGQALGVLR